MSAHTRRAFVRGVLAAGLLALGQTTGLARAGVELVRSRVVLVPFAIDAGCGHWLPEDAPKPLFHGGPTFGQVEVPIELLEARRRPELDELVAIARAEIRAARLLDGMPGGNEPAGAVQGAGQ